MTHFPNNNYFNHPYENTTFQVNMLDANTGMLVNQSIPFRKQQDVNNYLLHMSNLIDSRYVLRSINRPLGHSFVT